MEILSIQWGDAGYKRLIIASESQCLCLVSKKKKKRLMQVDEYMGRKKCLKLINKMLQKIWNIMKQKKSK